MNEYISKTKFEELMRKKARNNFDLYYADKSKHYHDNAIGYNMAADEAHDFPVADVQPVNQWISVKEKLPPEDESVLIYTIMGMCVAARWDDRFFVSKTASFVKYDVTHWMPLPEPPKDGDAE